MERAIKAIIVTKEEKGKSFGKNLQQKEILGAPNLF